MLAERTLRLQNGIDSVEILRGHVQGGRVIGGATYLSGFINKPGEIFHSGGLSHILVGGQMILSSRNCRSYVTAPSGLNGGSRRGRPPNGRGVPGPRRDQMVRVSPAYWSAATVNPMT